MVCINRTYQGFERMAERKGVSRPMLEMYMKEYMRTEGVRDEDGWMARVYKGTTREAKAFGRWLDGRLQLSDERVNTFGEETYQDAVSLYNEFSGRPTESYTAEQLALLRRIFPMSTIYTDYEGVQRMEIARPVREDGTYEEEVEVEDEAETAVAAIPESERVRWSAEAMERLARAAVKETSRKVRESIKGLKAEDSGLSAEEREELAVLEAEFGGKLEELSEIDGEHRMGTAPRDPSPQPVPEGERHADEKSGETGGMRVRLRPSEVSELANAAMTNASLVITRMMSSPDAAAQMFGDDLAGVDLSRMTRRQAVRVVGLRRIFEYVRDMTFARAPGRSLVNQMKMDLFREDFFANIERAWQNFVNAEDTAYSYEDEVVTPNSDPIDDIDRAVDMVMKGEEESYDDDAENVSTFASFAREVRTMLSTLVVTDEDGNTMLHAKWRVPYCVDPKTAMNRLFDWTRGCFTMDDMVRSLEAHRDANPWLNAVLRAVQDEPFRSVFFSQFRKVTVLYSSVGRNSAGYMDETVKLLNATTSSRNLIGSVVGKYFTGNMKHLLSYYDERLGGWVPNRENIARLRASVEELRQMLSEMSVRSYEELQANDALVNGIRDLLVNLGFSRRSAIADNVRRMLFDPAFIASGEGANRMADEGGVSGSETVAAEILDQCSDILDYLEPGEGEEVVRNPVEGERVDGRYNKRGRAHYEVLADMLSAAMPERVERMVYHKVDGKSKAWYSMQNPTPITDIVSRLVMYNGSDRDEIGRVQDYIMEKYLSFRQFNITGAVEDMPFISWLRTLYEGSERGLRYTFNTDYGGRSVGRLTNVETAMAMMSYYFGDNTSDRSHAWYAVPEPGEKQKMEFVRMPRYRIYDRDEPGYDSTNFDMLRDGFAYCFKQDVMRMRAVFDHAASEDGKIRDFDVYDEGIVRKSQAKRSAKDGIAAEADRLTVEDMRNPKLLATGLAFRYMQDLNSIFSDPAGEELARMVVDQINGLEVDTARFDELVNERVARWMDEVVDSEIAQFERMGLLSSEERAIRVGKDENGKAVYTSDKVLAYRFVDRFIEEGRLESYGSTQTEADAGEPLSAEQLAEYNGRRERLMRGMMREFILNSEYARTQMAQLFYVDPAMFGMTVNFFKRASVMRTGGMRCNPEAVDRDGVRYSDGKFRALYVTDRRVRSEVADYVGTVFESAIREVMSYTNMTEEEKVRFAAALRESKGRIEREYGRVNATDGQSLTSPTGVRKKLGVYGRWTDAFEDAYRKVRSGKYEAKDLDFMIQQIKPMLYGSEVVDYNGGENAAFGRVRTQTLLKTSEYMLFIADALAAGDESTNIYRAFYDFMEGSHFRSDGTYTQCGIDTICFLSSVKAGASDVVEIGGADTYDTLYAALREGCYLGESEDGTPAYRLHEFPIEDYVVVLENPPHFADHYQARGTQSRIKTLDDINPEARVAVGVGEGRREMTAKEATDRVKELTAQNIRASVARLAKALGLKGTRLEMNRQVSGMMREELMRDTRYGSDMLEAVTLDENGEFRIPPNSPLYGDYFENIICALVKNRVNKQRLPGGPVVQYSSLGRKGGLAIRFQDGDGKVLMTRAEFARSRRLAPGSRAADDAYMKYFSENMASVAYLEVAAPVPTKAIRRRITLPDGSLMSPREAVEAGVISDEQLKMIIYRVPTEGKYSVFPAKITEWSVGQGGEGIMLPAEITLISGTDFDNDKMYAHYKVFRDTDGVVSDRTLKSLANRYVDEEMDGVTRNLTEEEVQDLKTDTYLLFDRMCGASEEDRYDLTTPQRHAVEWLDGRLDEESRGAAMREEDRGTGGRLNETFDLEWGLLTSAENTQNMLNPGGFEHLKTLARVIQVISQEGYDPSVQGTFDGLMGRTQDELDGMISNNMLNPMHVSTDIRFRADNALGKGMVGVNANADVAHGFISMQDIRMSFGDRSFSFGGVQYGAGVRLDPMLNVRGQYVTRAIAEFLQASTDAGKDPTLGHVNFNEMTFNAYHLLLRIGCDPDLVALYMSLPGMKELAAEYNVANTEGRTTLDEVIDAHIARLNGQNIKLAKLTFTKDDLLAGYGNDDRAAAINICAVRMMKDLARIGQEVEELSLQTKYNSLSNAPGPTDADAIARRASLENMRERIANGESVFGREAAGLIENDPILKAFYDGTVSEGRTAEDGGKADVGITTQVFGRYTPNHTEHFKSMLSQFAFATGLELTAQTVNDLKAFYGQYALLSDRNTFMNQSEETRESLLYGFPGEVAEMQEAHPDNALLDRLECEQTNYDGGVQLYVSLFTSRMSADETKELQDAFAELWNDPETRGFCVRYIQYALLRGGLGGRNGALARAIPVSVQAGLSEYVDGLRNFNGYSFDVRNMVIQFLRNNTSSRRMVPELVHRHADDVWLDDDTGMLRFTDNATFRDHTLTAVVTSSVESAFGRSKVRYAQVIRFDGDIYVNTDPTLSSPQYIISGKLGHEGTFVEMNPDEDGTVMNGYAESSAMYNEEEEVVDMLREQVVRTGYDLRDAAKLEEALGGADSAARIALTSVSSTQFRKRVEDFVNGELNGAERRSYEEIIEPMC